MNLKDERYFYGGLDSDTEDRLLAKEDYRYAECARSGVSEGDNVGGAENIRGNSLVSYSLAASRPYCIGWCEDEENNAIIYFIADIGGNNRHEVVRYYKEGKTTETILSQPQTASATFTADLNFSDSYRITHANVIDGLLYWTDGYNAPRKVNIAKAIALGTASGYDVITEQVLDAIKYPPLLEPTVAYGTDNDYVYNNIRGKLFQFRYRYLYDDKEKSVLSPVSRMPLPLNEELHSGYYVGDTRINNYIVVTLELGVEIEEKIEICVREGNDGDWAICRRVDKSNFVSQFTADTSLGNPDRLENIQISGVDWEGDNRIDVGMAVSGTYIPSGSYITSIEQSGANWYVYISQDATGAATLTITVGTSYYYRFYNDTVKNSIDNKTETIRPFDYIPQIAGTQELIHKNILVYGDITEGYDNVDINIELDHTAWTVSSTRRIDLDIGIPVVPPTTPDGCYYIVMPTLTASDTIEVILPIAGTNYPINYYVADLSSYPGNAIAAFIAGINGLATSLGATFVASFAPPQAVLILEHGTGPPMSLPYGYYANQVDKYPSFKKGGWHEFGLVYYDRANRSGAVNRSSQSIYYVPLENEETGETDNAYRVFMEWKIKHLPPVWATHYQWVYSKSTNYTSFLQFFFHHIMRTNDGVMIDINSHINYYHTDRTFGKSVIPEYIWKKGDRIRFIGNIHATLGRIELFTDYLDFEINRQETVAGTNYIYVDAFNYESYSIAAFSTLIEIYTPKKDATELLFYEIGESFEIGNPGESNRYHKRGNVSLSGGSNFDQDPSDPINTPATGFFTNGGDVYIKTRDSWAYVCEGQEFSDFNDSEDYSIGRVNVEVPDAQQQQLKTGIRYGGIYRQNTNINDLNRFLFDDLKMLPEENGTIRVTKEIGYTLKVVQDRKNNSLYVGRTATREADATGSLYWSDRVLGDLIISEENYGTIHPESYTIYARNAYFFDATSGKVIRDSANGMYPISDYKKKTYFRDKADEIMTHASKDDIVAWGAYDGKYDEYILTFGNIANWGETVVFHGPSNRWKTFMPYTHEYSAPPLVYDWVPERAAYSGQTLIMFWYGQLWLSDENSTRNNFFGDQQKQIIRFVSNMEPRKIKAYKGMSVHSNKRWYCPNDGDITCPANTTYPNGMSSRLLSNKFIDVEGRFYSEFMRDGLTPNISTYDEGIMNGRNLRGSVIDITMENSETTEVVLFQVTVQSVLSELSV